MNDFLFLYMLHLLHDVTKNVTRDNKQAKLRNMIIFQLKDTIIKNDVIVFLRGFNRFFIIAVKLSM